MDELTKGTWLINSYKHFTGIRQDAPELSSFEGTDIAGKAGALLARLVADRSEVIESRKVKAFARQSSIRPAELPVCLRYLQKQEKIDYSGNVYEKIPDIEIYCFSVQDALVTSSKIYDTIDRSEYEEASLITLGETFILPRTDVELLEELTSNGFREDTARTTLRLQEALGLVKVTRSSDLENAIFYNEHAFAENTGKISRALQGLKSSDRQQIEDIQNLVDQNPGYLLDELHGKFSPNIVSMMEGIGLLDAITVRSDHGEAVFVTGAQLKGISIDARPLSLDVFHKAKVLLSSLRYGQYRSLVSRGKITSAEKMFNIVNKLLRGEWVGPCTAIGQDYKLLELDGVISTRPARNAWTSGIYEMQLRQHEVGVLVQQMLLYNHVLPEDETNYQQLLLQEPVVAYDIPEKRRNEIIASSIKPVIEVRDKLLQTIRTGIGRTVK